MGFEKVFQALPFSIAVLHLYSPHLANHAGILHVLAVSDRFILRDPVQSGSVNKWSVFRIGCACVFTSFACF